MPPDISPADWVVDIKEFLSLSPSSRTTRGRSVDTPPVQSPVSVWPDPLCGRSTEQNPHCDVISQWSNPVVRENHNWLNVLARVVSLAAGPMSALEYSLQLLVPSPC